MGRIRAYWPLRSTTGTDQGPNAYNLTLTNAPGTPGMFGHALAVNGTSNSYMQFGTGFTLKSICSFSFWIKFDDFTGGASNFHALISKRDDAVGDGNGCWQVSYYNSSHGTYPDTFAFYFYFGSWRAKIFNPAGIKAGVWYHIAMSIDIVNANNTKMWINGVPNGTPQGDATSSWSENNANHLGKIGYSTRAASSFKGSIQEVAVFDGAISDSEVKEYYDSATLPLLAPKFTSASLNHRIVRLVPPKLLGTSASTPSGINSVYFAGDRSLVGSWPLNTGSPIETARGGSLNASYTGTTPLAPGAFGNGFRFPGGSNTDKITIPSTTNYTSEVTLIAWVRPRAAPSTGRAAIISKNSYYAASATDFPIVLCHFPSGSIAFDLSKGDDYTSDAAVYLPLPDVGVAQSFNGFIPVVAVYKANTFAGLQVGDRYAELSINFTISTNSRNWTIGNDPFRQTGYGCFDGEISDVAILSRALSRAEISNYIRWAREIKSRKGVHARIFDIVTAGGGGTTTNVTLSETLSLSDSLNRDITLGSFLGETLSITDALDRSLTMGQALSETLSLTDALDVLKTHDEILTETLSLSDALVPDLNISEILPEALVLSDTLVPDLNISVALSESLSLSDGVIGGKVLSELLSETLSLSDSLSSTRTYSEKLDETLSISDALDRSLTMGQSLTESLALTDSIPTVGLNISAVLTDSMALTDALDKDGPEVETFPKTLTLINNLRERLLTSTSTTNQITSLLTPATKALTNNLLSSVETSTSLTNRLYTEIFDVLSMHRSYARVDDTGSDAITNVLRRVIEKPISFTNSIYESAVEVGQTFNINVRQYTPVTSSLRLFNALISDLDVTRLEYDVQVLLDEDLGMAEDVTGAIKQLSIKYGIDSHVGEIDVTWADWLYFTRLDPVKPEHFGRCRLSVYTRVNGEAWVCQGKFMVERRNTNVANEGVELTTWGRTATALLGEPYASPVLKTWGATTAKNVVQELCTAAGLTLDWDLSVSDYAIKQYKLASTQELPIEIIEKVVGAVGALITTDKNGILRVINHYG